MRNGLTCGGTCGINSTMLETFVAKIISHCCRERYFYHFGALSDHTYLNNFKGSWESMNHGTKR